MAGIATEDVTTVAERKKQPATPRERIDLRVEPEFYERVASAAERWGMAMSAYIRMAVTERVEKDEASAAPRGRKHKPSQD